MDQLQVIMPYGTGSITLTAINPYGVVKNAYGVCAFMAGWFLYTVELYVTKNGGVIRQ